MPSNFVATSTSRIVAVLRIVPQILTSAFVARCEEENFCLVLADAGAEKAPTIQNCFYRRHEFPFCLLLDNVAFRTIA